MFWGYLLIALPIIAYILLFTYETIVSFKRLLQKNQRKYYLGVGWEITHTLLVIGFTFFIWLCSSAALEISHAIYWPLIIVALAFIIRAILYLVLYETHQSKGLMSKTYGWLFAVSNLSILAGVSFVAVRSALLVEQDNIVLENSLIPSLWIGIGIIALSAIYPAIYIFKYSSRSK